MKLKTIIGMVASFFSLVGFAGEVTATSITAQQRYPWNGLVDIAVTVEGVAIDDPNTVWSFIASNAMTKSSIPISHITKNGTDVGAGSTWTQKFIWDAKADVGAIKIDDIALTVDVKLGVQLWENGPYWAIRNVGATKPEEYGYYFWWGDTVGYKRNAANDGWVSVKDGSSFSFSSGNCPTYGKDNSQLQLAGYIDSTGNLVAAYDAATAHLGAPWRMPTDAEFTALINNCDTEWMSCNGASGRLVKGRGAYASKSIFLPADGGGGSGLYSLGSHGNYWSSTTSSGSSLYAWGLCFNSGDFCRIDNNRSLGQSVRPVREFANGDAAPTGGATTHLTVDCRILTSVTAKQRYPWNGLVDITVTLQCAQSDLLNVEAYFYATNSSTKAVLPILHVTQNGSDSGSGTTWMRKFIWDAKADVGAVKIDDIALTVDVKLGVQLWENGPYWAICNVGATKPEEYGYYFWWGDTVGYKRNAANDGWVSVKDGSSFSFSLENCPTCWNGNSQLQSDGYIDSTGNLVAAYDAATAHLGAPWRMPTDAEFTALINNCDTEWTSRNGVSGRLVKGRGAYASKSIFLPAAGFGNVSNLINLGSNGYYWSSSPDSGDSRYAWCLYFRSGYFDRYSNDRFDGQSVRPVRGFAK